MKENMFSNIASVSRLDKSSSTIWTTLPRLLSREDRISSSRSVFEFIKLILKTLQVKDVAPRHSA
jgi:hypothetical protein